MSVVHVTKSGTDLILFKVQRKLCKQLLSPTIQPFCCFQDSSDKHSLQGSSLGSEWGSDSQRAAASGSNRQQQHQANRRQLQQQHWLQTPGQLQIVELAEDAGGPCPLRGAQVREEACAWMEYVYVHVHVCDLACWHVYFNKKVRSYVHLL